MKITAIGLDLAKQVFQVHGVDQRGRMVVSKRLRRPELVSVLIGSSETMLRQERQRENGKARMHR